MGRFTDRLITSGWPDLSPSNLDSVGDVPAAIDYRDVLAPVLRHHAPGIDMSAVFGRRVRDFTAKVADSRHSRSTSRLSRDCAERPLRPGTRGSVASSARVYVRQYTLNYRFEARCKLLNRWYLENEIAIVNDAEFLLVVQCIHPTDSSYQCAWSVAWSPRGNQLDEVRDIGRPVAIDVAGRSAPVGDHGNQIADIHTAGAVQICGA